jgi:TfoX/Sxy family transcriptional regulator of competence genes
MRDAAAMAYDTELADRLRAALSGAGGLTERAMFGGLAFMINGNMAVGASGQGGLLLRVNPAQTDALVAEPGVARFVMRGREMDGWLRVEESATESDEDLQHWVDLGVGYARSLPPK